MNIRFWSRLQILQLTPRAGGEHLGTVSIPGIAKLQLTPPEWGRTAVHPVRDANNLSSTHAPCGGECVPVVAISSAMQLQLTPPCGGELWSLTSSNFNAKASTRAPVWGANRTTAAEAYVRDYFNSRPRMGANSGSSNQRCQQPFFNSRPRVGANR